MAAEESSQGTAIGPEISESAEGDPPAPRDVPNLDDVLGEFREALCVLEMVQRALDELMQDSSEDIGSYAIALGHGLEMLDAVYERFDYGLLGYKRAGGDEADDDHDDDARDAYVAADGREDACDDSHEHATSAAQERQASRARKRRLKLHQRHGADESIRRLKLHPGYEEAIAVQARRLMDVRSTLDCAQFSMLRADEEVDVTGAVIIAHKELSDIIEQFDSLSLQRSAEKWLAEHEPSANTH